jgi:hypothetical protein
MTKFILLLHISILSVYRSKSFYSQTIPGLLFYFILYIQALIFVYSGIAEELNIVVFPELINEKFEYYIIALILTCLIIRTAFRTLPNARRQPVAMLPVKTQAIIRLALWRSMFNHFNLSWIMIIIPFILMNLEKDYGFVHFIAFSLVIILMDYLSVIFKLLSWRFFVILPTLLFMVIIFQDLTAILSHSISLFSEASGFSYVLLVFILSAFCIIADIAVVNLYDNKFYRAISPNEKQFQVLKRTKPWHFISPYSILVLKSIFRNTRTRTMLFSTILILILSLLLISKTAKNQTFDSYFFLTFLHGAVSFTLGYHLFSIDSSIYSLLQVSRIEQSRYLSAKYWLLNISSLVISFLCVPFIAKSASEYFMCFGNLLIVLSVCNPLVILTGIIFSGKMELSRSSFANAQGSSISQMLLLIVISIIPVTLKYLAAILMANPYADLILILAGLLVIANSNWIIEKLFLKTYLMTKYQKILSLQ